MSKDFVHLHLHSHFSLLDGAIKIPDLAQKAKEYGYKAVALTDHGNIFGAVEFYQEMKKVGVKPIIGIEAYFTNNRFEKKGEGSDSILADKNYHLILHAKDKKGFQNLMKLSSLAYTEGFYYKPRIDWELLEKYHEGLICQTACLKGFIPHLLAKGQFDEGYQYGKRLKDIFGEDLYFEIQINGLEEQEEANRGIIELAKKLGVKVVATNDSHYLNPEDRDAHDIIKALQMKMTLKELKEKGKAFKVGGLHFTRPEEMYEKFKGYEEVLKNTMEIAEKCNVEIETADTRGYLFPKYQIPGLDREATEEEKVEYFEKLAREGLERRIEKLKTLSPAKHKEYKERLEYEINVIKQMGFPEYFLIVQDFINFAKENGIPVGPGRGCVFPDTKVLLSDGTEIKIKDLKVGQFVITHRGDILPVVNKYVYDVDEEITILKFENGELCLTSDHKVWAVKNILNKQTRNRYLKYKNTQNISLKERISQNLNWIEAGKLKAGDFVVIPRVKSKNKEILFDLTDFIQNLKFDEKYVFEGRDYLNRYIPFDKKFAKFLGIYLTNGKSLRNSVKFVFKGKDKELITEFINLINSVFGLYNCIETNFYKNKIEITVNSKVLAEFLTKIAGFNKFNKKIPAEIIENGKDEYLKELISYLFRTGKNPNNLYFGTFSKKLLSQVQFLLVRYGYLGRIFEENLDKNLKLYIIKISGKQLLRWEREFKGFSFNKKLKFEKNNFFVDENYIYLRLQAVKRKRYRGKVYDISVPIDTSYIGNGIAIHNSAAGSLVAYALGITDVDPLQHGLIFERFLNPERISMPDIDVDFCQENRGKIIDYVKKKYGENAVAQIITYNFMKSKSVIRDVARVLGFTVKEGDKIAKMILPGPVQGSTLSIKENLEQNPEFRKLYETDKRVKELIDLAMKLEGSARHTGIHAAGVVIAPGNLEEFVPVYVDKDGTKATQFDMGTLEMLGLVKMDFLGLKTLTELDYMRKLIEERRGIDINFLELPIDDPNVYKLLQSGKTNGVFQLESKGMQNLLVRLKPDKFDEIIAILALFRPGPLMSGMVDEFIDRKHGRKPVEYPFEEVKEILEETYGLVVYQEQVMFMANILSGFSMAEADTLRKAIGKKKADLMAKMKEKFIDGAVKRGFNKEKITKLWEDIEKFASYSFNKSHSTAYAYLTYWTAYIKAYYPEEFFTVKLSLEKNDDKFLNILNDMKDFGIELLPPDINKSEANFNIEGKGRIRFGLARIKNVGEDTAKLIVEERKKKGNYTDIFDLAERFDSKKVNKRVLEKLIKAGAFDFTGVDRGILLTNIEKALATQKTKEKKTTKSLFSLMGKPQKTEIVYEKGEPLTEGEKLRYEKEALGFYLSGHPLKGYEKELKNYVLKINRLFEKKSGDKVRVAGVISSIKRKKTKSGSTMAILSLQDETGFIDVRVFIEKLEDTSFLEEDRIVVVEGIVDINEEGENVSLSMNALDIYPVENLNRQTRAVRFIISEEKAKNGVAEKLKALCEKYKGDKEVILEIVGKDFKAEIMAHSDFYVDINENFKHELSQILEPSEFNFE